MGDAENGGKAMSPFMKTVLLVATAGFLTWAGWLTNNALASGQERAKVELEQAVHDAELRRIQEAHTAQVRELNGHLSKIRERLRNIETALAVHDVH